MALFTINRYLGDEQDSFCSKISDDTKSQRLDKLLSYAKSKKRKREANGDHDINKDVEMFEEMVPQTSKHEECADLAKPSPKKKRKKMKTKGKCDLVNNDQDELQDEYLSSDASENLHNSVTSSFEELQHSNCSKLDVDSSHDPIDSSHDDINDSQDPVDGLWDKNICDNDSSDGSHNSVDNPVESNTEYFPVLGSKTKNYDKPVVFRKLPSWMENPTLVEIDIKENSVPVIELKDVLPNAIQLNLHRMKIFKFFPVQRHVIPDILSTARGPLLGDPSGKRAQDICVNAPTGSGKTLAYAVPIVTALMNHVVCHVRGLIVVPSRDLALQVKTVLVGVAKGTGLKIVTITGHSPMEKEQGELVNQKSIPISSGADIVVATPGRLVDHMNLTKHFCLKHLRFLVIDEVDRLLDQSFQDWSTKLFDFISKDEGNRKSLSLYSCLTADELFPSAISDPKLDIFIPVPRSPSPLCSATSTHCSVQKLLFSATIPQNPEKLALLKLYSPKLFTTATVQESSPDQANNYTGRFALPSTLKEYSIVCPGKHKPLAVIHLIENEKINRVLCFTSSKDSTHRLCLLLKHYGIPGVAEYSARLSQKKRRFVLSEFACGNINMLVCSDAMSRGMDVDKVR